MRGHNNRDKGAIGMDTALGSEYSILQRRLFRETMILDPNTTRHRQYDETVELASENIEAT